MAKPNSEMVKNGQEFPPKFLQEDEFLSKFLSKEKYNNSSKQGEASFRVLYYGGATGSVPFVWESQPGTPKHTFYDNPLPPLTPPPSYKFSHQANCLQKKHSKHSKICHPIFSRTHSKKINVSPTFSPSSSVSSSYSLPSTPSNTGIKIKGRSRSVARFEIEQDEYEPKRDSPTSTLCFGPRNIGSSRKFKGYYHPIKNVKKVMLSIVGHGTAN